MDKPTYTPYAPLPPIPEPDPLLPKEAVWCLTGKKRQNKLCSVRTTRYPSLGRVVTEYFTGDKLGRDHNEGPARITEYCHTKDLFEEWIVEDLANSPASDFVVLKMLDDAKIAGVYISGGDALRTKRWYADGVEFLYKASFYGRIHPECTYQHRVRHWDGFMKAQTLHKDHKPYKCAWYDAEGRLHNPGPFESAFTTYETIPEPGKTCEYYTHGKKYKVTHYNEDGRIHSRRLNENEIGPQTIVNFRNEEPAVILRDNKDGHCQWWKDGKYTGHTRIVPYDWSQQSGFDFEHL